MKKKLLRAIGVSLWAAVPSSLWAKLTSVIKVQGQSYPPGAVETCTGGSIPPGSQILAFTNTTSGVLNCRESIHPHRFPSTLPSLFRLRCRELTPTMWMGALANN